MTEIRLTSEQLSMISLFQGISGASARDCIIDDKLNRVIFVIQKGQMGLAIGKDGASVKKVERAMRVPVEVVEWSDDPVEMVKNALGAKMVQDVKMTDRMDGTKGILVTVDSKKKGAVLGQGGKNAEKVRMLARRYFDVTNVQIVSEF